MSYIFRVGSVDIFVSKKILSDKHTEREKNQALKKKKKANFPLTSPVKIRIPVHFASLF